MNLKDDVIQIKLLLLGDGKVGKTSLRRRFLGEGFQEEYLETLGADFSIKNVRFGEFVVRYNIWDIAGQKKFSQIRKGFFTGAQVGLILYDMTNKKSFDNLENWIKELIANNGKGNQIPVMIIGNKSDLKDQIETIDSNLGQKRTQELKEQFKLIFTSFIETSAKNGENVENAFEEITKSFLEIHNISK